MKIDTTSNTRLVELLRKIERTQLEELYNRHGGSNVEELVSMIRRDGSNSFATWLYRWGDGVHYAEIVNDVANQVKVDRTNKTIKTEEDLERLIMECLMQRHFESLSEEERRNFEEQMNALGEEYQNFYRCFFEASGTGILLLVNTVGRQAVAKIIEQVMAKFIAARAGTFITARAVGLAVPFLNVAVGIWTAIDLADPAYRKTVPTVFHIAYLRLQFGGNDACC